MVNLARHQNASSDAVLKTILSPGLAGYMLTSSLISYVGQTKHWYKVTRYPLLSSTVSKLWRPITFERIWVSWQQDLTSAWVQGKLGAGSLKLSKLPWKGMKVYSAATEQEDNVV